MPMHHAESHLVKGEKKERNMIEQVRAGHSHGSSPACYSELSLSRECRRAIGAPKGRLPASS
jgi:hypothetical protein